MSAVGSFLPNEINEREWRMAGERNRNITHQRSMLLWCELRGAANPMGVVLAGAGAAIEHHWTVA
ncbi:hypothetical protein [Mesorhizobium sp. M0140]|uniref:hypothetical protein n=1 Tax=Mesorhizobium sp. M0140 TaxID=2956893 RepID=UPI003339E24F